MKLCHSREEKPLDRGGVQEPLSLHARSRFFFYKSSQLKSIYLIVFDEWQQHQVNFKHL